MDDILDAYVEIRDVYDTQSVDSESSYTLDILARNSLKIIQDSPITPDNITAIIEAYGIHSDEYENATELASATDGTLKALKEYCVGKIECFDVASLIESYSDNSDENESASSLEDSVVATIKPMQKLEYSAADVSRIVGTYSENSNETENAWSLSDAVATTLTAVSEASYPIDDIVGLITLYQKSSSNTESALSLADAVAKTIPYAIRQKVSLVDLEFKMDTIIENAKLNDRAKYEHKLFEIDLKERGISRSLQRAEVWIGNKLTAGYRSAEQLSDAISKV